MLLVFSLFHVHIIGTAQKLEREAKIRRPGSGEKGGGGVSSIPSLHAFFALSPLSMSLEQANRYYTIINIQISLREGGVGM